jgi:multidrug efflux pump subunit AcrA (membrane-fusion protein)
MTSNINLKGKYWLPLAAALGFSVLFVLGLLRPTPKVLTDVDTSPLVEIVQVEKRRLDPIIIGYGRAQPKENWSAISEVTGRVIFRHKELERGRTISKDTIVLKIDPVDYQLAVAQSRSNLKSAELELDRVKLNKRSYEQSRAIEKGRISLAKKELTRKEQLKKQGLISSSELEAQRNAVLVQEKSLWDLDSKLALIPTDTEVAEANVKVAQAKLRESERSLTRTEVILPFDARIGLVNAELDQVVNKQEKLLEVHDLSEMEVTANMSLFDIRRLVSSTTGQAMLPGETVPDIRNLNLSAQVTLDIGDQQFSWQGTIDRINDSIDIDANTIGLTVKVQNNMGGFDPKIQAPLLKDMYVKVEVTGESQAILVVPSRALHGNKLYLVGVDNLLTITEVEVSYEQAGLTAIKSGVEENDTVVISDILAPTQGMKIRAASSANSQPAMSVDSQP